jgi:hypothetical protein
MFVRHRGSPHFLGNQLTDGNDTVSLMQQSPLPPRRFLVLISVKRWFNPRATMRLEGLGQLKIPIIPLGIEPATSKLVA